MTHTPDQNPIHIALAGNPNTGKTSIFNAITGTAAKVGNYPGVTVEKRSRNLPLSDGKVAVLVDLPGTYSLTARSADEEIAMQEIIGAYNTPPADVIVAVVDATNLARCLYLVMQLAELQRPMVLALNMCDLAKTQNVEVDSRGLSAALGIPVVETVAREGTGVEELTRIALDEAAIPSASLVPDLIEADQASVDQLKATLKSKDDVATTGYALWLLTSSTEMLDSVSPAISSTIRDLKTVNRQNASDQHLNFNRRIIAARYQRVDELIAKFVQTPTARKQSKTQRWDAVLTHPIWGMAAFVLTMGVLFQAVYSWCDPFIGWIEAGMEFAGQFLSANMSEGILQEFLAQGLVAGIGNILVFLPQILLLFLGIAVLEDSGYMARAAVLVDSLMRRVGLNGKAFVPLLSSFACAIPGIMAARTIENRRDRLVTILIAPLMSCSARLPVYTLVIGAVFASSDPVFGIFSLGGLIIVAMYFLGLFSALAVAFVLKRTVLKAPTPAFVMELPDYKWPSIRTVLLQMYRRGAVFVTQTGTVILALSIILWALMAYPRETPPNADQLSDSQVAQYQLSESFAGSVGHFIEPIIEPLGFDWKIGIGLVGSFAAREVLVSTLGQVYGVGGDADEESLVLRKALLSDIDPATDKPRFTPLVGVSLMVFFVIAMQCLSTVAVVRRETASWTWPIVMIVYMNALAWLASFATFQIGRSLGLG